MDIELEALKCLYEYEWKSFTKEYGEKFKDDKVDKSCEIALDVLKSLRQKVTENEHEMKKLIDNKDLHYRKRSEDTNFTRTLDYEARKKYLSKIEEKLKVKGLIPEIDSRWNVVFARKGEVESAGAEFEFKVVDATKDDAGS